MAGFGGSVKLSGETEYLRALKQIKDNLTLLGSEMKVVDSLYDKNDASTEKLTKQNDVLAKKLDVQNEKLAEAKKMLDQAKNSTDSNAQTVAKWQTEVNKAQAEVNATTRAIADNNKKIKENKGEYVVLTETVAEQKNKLKDLKSEYKNVSSEQGRSSQEAKDLKKEIKSLSGELKDNKSDLKEAKKGLDDFGDGADEAGKSAVKMGDLIKANLISEAIIGGVKALGSAMVEVSKKAFELGKSAIVSFGEYEQLIGGVETLFEESAPIVENYANNAYKTAGLSANEYMSTVTSFTASLLQSLDGDTAKTAEIADMAITDMADNANKMGTSMESIQNAYQGFAKQNYTMLDNLKLGYGGTKEEMERLLAEASKIAVEQGLVSESALKASVDEVALAKALAEVEKNTSNLASKQASASKAQISYNEAVKKYGANSAQAQKKAIDLSEAQRKLTEAQDKLTESQEKLNTVQQGDSTIFDINNLNDVYQAIHLVQGELGITGATANEASTTIQGSVSAMKSSWQNLLTGMADDNADFGALIGNFVDSVLTVGNNILPRIKTVIGGMGELVGGLLTELVPEIVNIIPPMIESSLPVLITAIETSITSILEVIPQLMSGLESIIPQLINSIVVLLPLLIDAGIQVILSLVNGISASLPTLIPVAIDAILTIVENLIDNIDMIIDAGIDLLIGLAEGLIDSLPNLIAKIPIIIEKLLNAISTNYPKILGAGIEILVKLAGGLVSAIPDLIAVIPSIMWSVIKSFGTYAKELWNVGGDLLSGLWKGIADWATNLYAKIKDLGKNIVNTFKNVFGIHSPSKVFADEIGNNLALGLGEGFEHTMSDISDQMTGAVPTDFDIEANANVSTRAGANTFGNMVEAFKQALREVNIVLDDEVAGRFVTDTVERVVYQ